MSRAAGPGYLKKHFYKPEVWQKVSGRDGMQPPTHCLRYTRICKCKRRRRQNCPGPAGSPATQHLGIKATRLHVLRRNTALRALPRPELQRFDGASTPPTKGVQRNSGNGHALSKQCPNGWISGWRVNLSACRLQSLRSHWRRLPLLPLAPHTSLSAHPLRTDGPPRRRSRRRAAQGQLML